MIIKYKPQGQTLGQLTREVQEEAKDKICYIGRLDPLASGLVCFLVGDECISSRSRLHSDKTYCFNLILGISTDTGDALGLIQKMSAVSLGAVGIADIVKKYNNRKLFPIEQSSMPSAVRVQNLRVRGCSTGTLKTKFLTRSKLPALSTLRFPLNEPSGAHSVRATNRDYFFGGSTGAGLSFSNTRSASTSSGLADLPRRFKAAMRKLCTAA